MCVPILLKYWCIEIVTDIVLSSNLNGHQIDSMFGRSNIIFFPKCLCSANKHLLNSIHVTGVPSGEPHTGVHGSVAVAASVQEAREQSEKRS